MLTTTTTAMLGTFHFFFRTFFFIFFSFRGEGFHVTDFVGSRSKRGCSTCSELPFFEGVTKAYVSTWSDIDGTKVCGPARGFASMLMMPSTSFSHASAVVARARTFFLLPAAPPASFDEPRPPPPESLEAAARVRCVCRGRACKG